MTIDIHTHVFPDALAPKAIAALTASINGLYTPVHDGTVSGLLSKMDSWGIDISVVQPVVTKQSQVVKTNEWVSAVQSERIIGFGGIYPHTDNYKEDIDYVVSLGLKGLKFHAEYQDFILDSPEMLKIYDYALSKNLIILHHAGYDPAFTPPFRSNPKRFANIAKELKGGIIIAAHFGGHDQWDDVLTYLAGTGIYLDTSMGFEYFTSEQFLNIKAKHGADKILFGSDSPWSSAGTEIEHIKSLPLSDEEKFEILGGNAKKILNL
jgi:predicted TIM-barrel fold metal-dependent hydrolase